MQTSSDARYYKLCEKCNMKGLKLKGTQVKGLKRIIIYKCVYCNHIVKREA